MGCIWREEEPNRRGYTGTGSLPWVSCRLEMVVKFQAEVGKPRVSGFPLCFSVYWSPVILSFLSSSLLYEVRDGGGNPVSTTVCVGHFSFLPQPCQPSDMNVGFHWNLYEGSIDKEMK